MNNKSNSFVHRSIITPCNNESFFETNSVSTNREQCIIIWFELESEKEQHCKKYPELLACLCTIADRFETFFDIDDCIDLISALVYEKAFLIMSLNEAQQRLSLIYDLPQIAYIYIYNETKIEDLTNDFYNSTQIFSSIRNVIYKINNALFDQLKRDVNVVQTRLVPFTLCPITSVTNKSTQDLSKDQVSYRWNQLLLTALLKLPENSTSKQDILDECKLQHFHNNTELRKIEQFERTYKPDQAVWWYTRDSFLFRSLNKALRTEDIDNTFKFRFFITDLYNQLADLYSKEKLECPNILTVYRGQKLTHHELETLKSNINGIICMNTFLSTSKNKDVALIYAGNGSERPLFESILFEFQIDVNQVDKPFADISKISFMRDEDEVLLSMSMTFIIKSVEETNENFLKVQLKSVNQNDIPMNDYFKYMEKKMEKSDELLAKLGEILFEMGEFNKEEKYYLMLLEEGTESCARIYNNLGLCYYHKRDYDRALHYYAKALDHYRETGCDKMPYCTQTYVNIGSIYENNNDYQKAMEFYDVALKIHLKYPKYNIRGFILALDHIAGIYHNYGKYNKALDSCFQALDLCNTSLLRTHPDTASIYSRISNVYCAIGQYDVSLVNCKTALRIAQETLPNNHITIPRLLNDIGTVHDIKGEYDYALDYYTQARAILTKVGHVGVELIATVYSNMGIVYRKKDEYSLALDCYMKCLEIRKKHCQENSKNMAIIYSHIGNLYCHMENPEKAIEYEHQAIAIIRKSQVPDDPFLGTLYNNIGRSYQDLGNINQALSYYNQALDIKYQYLPPSHSSIAITLYNISVLLGEKGDIELAISYAEKALQMFDDTLPVNHPCRLTYVNYLNYLNIAKTLLHCRIEISFSN